MRRRRSCLWGFGAILLGILILLALILPAEFWWFLIGAGLIGAGRSEVMQGIFGSRKVDAGQVVLNGKPISFSNCAQAIRQKIAMVPEDRKLQGLVLKSSVGFNITLANLDAIVSGIAYSTGKKNRLISRYIDALRIKTQSADTIVSNLSGGNQQKVVLAKWLATEPELLILDEPTRGVDVGAKAEIYSIINDAAKQGMAVILVSSDLPEIINMCDSVCVMHEGHITGKLSRGELSQENIMKLATGGGSAA